MKHHFLTGVAVVAALAFSAPVWAQSPTGGNAMGVPGPNPGGPGLTPYSSGPNPGGSALSGPRTAPSAPMAPSAMPPSSMSDTSSAMPPKHHRASRHASHGKPSHHPSRFSNLQGNVANQLNQEELQRLQAGNFPPPPPPGMMPPGQPGGRMTTHGTVQ
ncbi:MAG TPA: hypothetical protein VGM15_05590 [Burkholderiaceae bacterium]|jgi:hypothetical protein